MLFQNAWRLLTENFKNVYKIALYKIIVTLISTAVTVAIILPALVEIVNSAPVQVFLEDVKEFFIALFAADGKALTEVKEQIFATDGSLHNVFVLITSKAGEIVLAIVGCALVYLVKRFIETVCYFAVGNVLNDKMTTYADTPLRTSLVANLGKASVYAAVYVPVVFLFDVLTFGVVVMLFYLLPVVASLFCSVTLIVLLQALKLTATGVWMPAMTADNKRLKNAICPKDKFIKKQLGKYYGTYIIAVYLVIIVNMIAGVCTVGSALLLSVPASYMLFICLQYVYYYTAKGKKYFITYEKIATNPDHGDRAHIFDYIDEVKTSENKQENFENTEES